MQLKENTIYKVDWKKIFGEVGRGTKEAYKQCLLTFGEFFCYEKRSGRSKYIITVIDGILRSISFAYLRNNAIALLDAEYLIEVTEPDELAKAHLLGL
jgi:hypothetical protein